MQENRFLPVDALVNRVRLCSPILATWIDRDRDP